MPARGSTTRIPAMILLAIPIWSLLAPRPAEACDCVGLPPLSAAVREELPYIFLGQVLEIVETSEHTTVTTWGGASTTVRPKGREVRFRVAQAWRGVDRASFGVSVPLSDCMFPFEPGQTYLVFARAENGGVPSTGLCSRTSPADRAGPVLKLLGPPAFVAPSAP